MEIMSSEDKAKKNEAKREELIDQFKLSKDATDDELAKAASEHEFDIEFADRKPTDEEFSKILSDIKPEVHEKMFEEVLVQSLNNNELEEKFLGFVKDEDGNYRAQFTKPSIRPKYVLSKEHIQSRMMEFTREINRAEVESRDPSLWNLDLDRMQKVLDNWPKG